MTRARLTVTALVGFCFAPIWVRAQGCPDSTHRDFIVPGGIADERLRREELAGCARAVLIRSPMTLSSGLAANGRRPKYQVVMPQTSLTWNSALPQSMNDGAQWAGRGASMTTLVGMRFRWWRLAGVLAPELVGTTNGLFSFQPAAISERSPYASWVNINSPSIDQPTRYGYRSSLGIGPGQSSVEVRARQLGAGVSTESMWWGPGVRNAIVMSNNAAGIPQVYLRSTSPVRTWLGSVEGRILLGVLTESPYFDNDPQNDHRSLSAGVLTLRAAVDSNLAIGVTRVSYGELRRVGGLATHTFDFLKPLPASGRDELQSVFARWGFPESGFEVHGEWARVRLPSLHEILVDPERTQGYTLGLQWMRPLSDSGRRVRIQAEATMLEQPRQPTGGQPLGYYASVRVPQGYTQFGQVIGAASGPGSSSQWIASDVVLGRWLVGAELGRIRWDDDAYYAQTPAGFSYFTHDISLYEGVSALRSFDRLSLRAGVIHTARLNYQNQSGTGGIFWSNAFDVTNYHLTLSVAWRR